VIGQRKWQAGGAPAGVQSRMGPACYLVCEAGENLMREKKWAVTFARDGEPDVLEMNCPYRPAEEDAAILIRNKLGPKVIPTLREGWTQPTVEQIRSHGIEITDIDEVDPGMPGA